LNKTATNIVQSADHITAVGTAVVRYGLVVVITWIGLMKFTGSEAMRIQVFISHSPFMSWQNGILSIRAQSDLIGTIEILTAVLIVLNVVSPRLGAVGGALRDYAELPVHHAGYRRYCGGRISGAIAARGVPDQRHRAARRLDPRAGPVADRHGLAVRR
jgi:Protein of unknown function, DUF417